MKCFGWNYAPVEHNINFIAQGLVARPTLVPHLDACLSLLLYLNFNEVKLLHGAHSTIYYCLFKLTDTN